MQSMNWLQRLADSMDMAEESLPGVPVIEIAGDQRVLIEGHNGVTGYSNEQISINVQNGTVFICGRKLELIKMTREQLVIAGWIESVQLQRRHPR